MKALLAKGLLVVGSLLVLLPSSYAAAPAEKAKAKPVTGTKAASGPNTHTVKQEAFKVVLKLSGAFEAAEKAELSVRPTEWTTLSVLSAAPPGKSVNKGDVVLTFETDKLDQQIRELEVDCDLAELAVEQAKLDVEHLEKSTPDKLRAAKQADAWAQEDLKRFTTIDRSQSEKSAAFAVKRSEQMLEYQTEELKQLEKMYKADDLTEETEEIILKRQRDTVESARFSLERAKLELARTLQIALPRQLESMTAAAREKSLAAAKADSDLPRALQKARLELEKQRRQQHKANERLTRLKQDRGMMTVTAPRDGVLLYGQSKRGKWPSLSVTHAKLTRGGQVKPGEVFMTIIVPHKLFVLATVDEKDVGKLNAKQTGNIRATAFPDYRINLTEVAFSYIPIETGKFEARFSIRGAAPGPTIVPGMTCDANVLVYENPKALTLPCSAVFAEGDRHFVYLAKGKVKREVKVGKRSEEKVEILSGLNVGDKILAQKPKEGS